METVQEKNVREARQIVPQPFLGAQGLCGSRLPDPEKFKQSQHVNSLVFTKRKKVIVKPKRRRNLNTIAPTDSQLSFRKYPHLA